jgi:NDP-sugar pyrophosphorylase family protein
MKIKHALILAAGRGSRLMPLTIDNPKPLTPYLNSTLIGVGIDKLKKKIPNIHITVGYKAPMVSEYVAQFGVSTIINTTEYGNAWFLFGSLLKHLNEPVLVLTCDNVTELNFDFFQDQYESRGEPACMLVPISPVKGITGDFIEEKKYYVSKVGRDISTPFYCTGIQVLNPYKINQLVETTDNFYDIWNTLISKKSLMVSDVYKYSWISIDTVEQLHNLYKETDPKKLNSENNT